MPTTSPPAPPGGSTALRPELPDTGPRAPEMPSFASLRNPRSRTAVDVLVPGLPPAPAPAPEPPPAPAAGPRPATYADLRRLGLRLVRDAVGVPVRLARRSVGGALCGLLGRPGR